MLNVRSQTVHPEGVLGGWVSQDHVRVVEHVQSVQGKGINLEFIQGELTVRVEADIADPSQCAGQFFREAGRGLSSHWWVGGEGHKSQLSPGSPPPCPGKRAWVTSGVVIEGPPSRAHW